MSMNERCMFAKPQEYCQLDLERGGIARCACPSVCPDFNPGTTLEYISAVVERWRYDKYPPDEVTRVMWIENLQYQIQEAEQQLATGCHLAPDKGRIERWRQDIAKMRRWTGFDMEVNCQ